MENMTLSKLLLNYIVSCYGSAIILQFIYALYRYSKHNGFLCACVCVMLWESKHFHLYPSSLSHHNWTIQNFYKTLFPAVTTCTKSPSARAFIDHDVSVVKVQRSDYPWSIIYSCVRRNIFFDSVRRLLRSAAY